MNKLNKFTAFRAKKRKWGKGAISMTALSLAGQNECMFDMLRFYQISRYSRTRIVLHGSVFHSAISKHHCCIQIFISTDVPSRCCSYWRSALTCSQFWQQLMAAV
jgi:hypothetical protein